MSKLPIVAAVPNYNMGDHLVNLLPDLLYQGYDGVYVLDDASTDGSREVVAAVSSDIQFVAGDRQVGAGANRNRIIPALDQGALIHFIDADMRIDTECLAERAREATPTGPFGFVAGLISEESGRQMAYNYGPRQSLRNDLGGLVHLKLQTIGEGSPDRERQLRRKYRGFLADWPDPTQHPVRRPIYWGAEANLIFDSRVFSSAGGFDPKLRDHEIQDLAIRFEAAGLARIFDPSVASTHLSGQVRRGNRTGSLLSAEAAIARKHGLVRWLFSK